MSEAQKPNAILVAAILNDRELIRALDDAELGLVEVVLRRHITDEALQAITDTIIAGRTVKLTSSPDLGSDTIELVSEEAPEPDENHDPSSLDTTYTVYVDGSCSGNPGPGGWGVYFASGAEYSGSVNDTTNQRMEIQAAIEALRRIPAGFYVTVVSDSKYVVETMLGTYSKKSNIDLWKQLEDAARPLVTSWHWERGHNGNPGNERANTLATEATKRLKNLIQCAA